MAKTKKEEPKVSIDGKEYIIDSLLDEQKALLNHVADLDRKLKTGRFNLEQMQMGRDAIYTRLSGSLIAKMDKSSA